MKYNKLREHVTSTNKIKSIARWRGLLLNEATGAIFPASKWGMKQAAEQRRPYDERSVSFYFMPGDICVLNNVPLGVFDLSPYGISGKFESRKSWKSEFTYIHDLFDKYESFPGMKVNMLDGRPLDARLLDDIKPGTQKLAEFEARLMEIKNIFFVINRMKDAKPEYPRNINISHYEVITKRRDLLKRLFEKPLSKTPDWSKKLEPFYARFWYNSGSPDHNKVFDNMIRFDKAALFRALKVIT